MWQKLAKCYPPQLELIPLLLLAFTVYIVASNYADLPDSIPTHFDAQGDPDGWSGKSAIFLSPGLGLFFYILFSAINVGMAVVKDPRSLINLPEIRKAALTDSQTEQLRLFVNRSLFLMKVVAQGLTAYLAYITVEVALERASGLGLSFFLLIGALLLLAALLVWRSLRITRAPKQP